jgi:pimeloyl-ACP methyl ester carboxylesterase
MHHEADVVLPELLERLAVRRPVLIGHSDGASIALLAVGAGLDVAGVVCLAPHVFVEPASIVGIEAARAASESTDLVERLGRYHADPVATFRGWNDVWLSEAFRAWNIEDRLGAITAPVLAIQGGADDYGTFDQLDAITAGCAGPVSQFRIARAGHSPHLDARELVVSTISGFVRTLSDD